LVLPIDAAGQVADDLVFRVGMQFVVPQRDIQAGPPRPITVDDRNHPGYYRIDSVEIPRVTPDESVPAEVDDRALACVFPSLAYLASSGERFLIVLRFRVIRVSRPIYATLFLTGFVMLERVCLITLLQASLWTEARYLFPVMPIYTSFFVIFIQQGCFPPSQRHGGESHMANEMIISTNEGRSCSKLYSRASHEPAEFEARVLVGGGAQRANPAVTAS
jgi:hypothetical protein